MISWIWIGVVSVIGLTAIILVLWLRYFHNYPIRATLRAVLGMAAVAISGVFVTGAKVTGGLNLDLSPMAKAENLEILFPDPDPIAVALIVFGLLILGGICVLKLPPEPR